MPLHSLSKPSNSRGSNLFVTCSVDPLFAMVVLVDVLRDLGVHVPIRWKTSFKLLLPWTLSNLQWIYFSGLCGLTRTMSFFNHFQHTFSLNVLYGAPLFSGFLLLYCCVFRGPGTKQSQGKSMRYKDGHARL